eukprot:4529930-Lingulodinium_polyedra.AAC.1
MAMFDPTRTLLDCTRVQAWSSTWGLGCEDLGFGVEQICGKREDCCDGVERKCGKIEDCCAPPCPAQPHPLW